MFVMLGSELRYFDCYPLCMFLIAHVTAFLIRTRLFWLLSIVHGFDCIPSLLFLSVKPISAFKSCMAVPYFRPALLVSVHAKTCCNCKSSNNPSVFEAQVTSCAFDMWTVGRQMPRPLTPSLPWCHLKTVHKSVKFETFKLFCLLFCTGMSKDFHQNV